MLFRALFPRPLRKKLFVLFGLAVLLACATIPILAQLPTGTILGVVKDTSGAVLPGVSVTVRNADTGAMRTLLTGEDGAYRVPALAVGRYDITVELAGFNTAVQRGVELAVAQEAVVNFTLQVGAVSQQVEVVAEAALVNTTSSSLGGLVNETSMSELPLNGRNFIDLSLLQPGVTQQLNLVGSAGTGGPRFSSNGAPIFSNNFLLDGAPMVNIFGGSPGSAAGTTLGVGGIKEYKVLTNTFSAEYGMTMGSQMIIVSKGGSNQFHGEAFEYLRNSALDARNFFYTRVTSGGRRLPQFQRNNFGGSLGGPINKDKTFFFGVYEGLRERLGITQVNSTVPAGCHGALGAVITPANCSLTTSNVTIGSRSPAVVPLINLFLLPNLPGDQYAFDYKKPTNENYWQMRVDQNFSQKDSFFVRYTLDDTIQTTARAYRLFLDPWKSRNQFATFSENHIFSPVLLNTIRFSASRMGIETDSVAQVSGPQYSFIQGQGLGGVTPGSGITAFGPDSQSRATESQNVITASDDIFYTLGRQSFKFGVLANYYQENINPHASYPGSITFANVPNFLQGIPQSQTFAQPGSDSSHFFTYKTLGFYVQDDVRLLAEHQTTFRVISADGRPYPKDPDPLINGNSIGRWEGDTFVIDVISFDEKTPTFWSQPIKGKGYWFHSDAMHVIERFRRPDSETLIYQVTVEDPKVLTKPWTSAPQKFTRSDYPLNEYYCTNEQDGKELRRLNE